MNPTIDLIQNRASLRQYANRPVTQEHRDLIISSALRAPTAGNMMLYSILVVEDQAKKKQLSRTCDNQPFIAKAPLVLIFLADLQRWFDYYALGGVKEFCSSHQLDYATPDEGDLLLAANDAIIAAQTAALAAESLGIGSCYIGDILENYETHREMFNLPQWVLPITMLCLGYYPDNAPKVLTPRFEEKFIVFTDTYKRLNSEEFNEMFSEREKSLPRRSKYGARNFAQYAYARKTGASFAREMARSVRAAIRNWKGDSL